MTFAPRDRTGGTTTGNGRVPTTIGLRRESPRGSCLVRPQEPWPVLVRTQGRFLEQGVERKTKHVKVFADWGLLGPPPSPGQNVDPQPQVEDGVRLPVQEGSSRSRRSPPSKPGRVDSLCLCGRIWSMMKESPHKTRGPWGTPGSGPSEARRFKVEESRLPSGRGGHTLVTSGSGRCGTRTSRRRLVPARQEFLVSVAPPYPLLQERDRHHGPVTPASRLREWEGKRNHVNRPRGFLCVRKRKGGATTRTRKRIGSRET